MLIWIINGGGKVDLVRDGCCLSTIFFFFFNWVMTISPQPANTLPWYRGFIECREKPIAGSGIPGIARCGCK